MLRLLKDRFPPIQQILAVYGIIALFIHGWTLIRFFWKLPSWEHFLTYGEISISLAYSMALNLLECISIMFVLLVLCAVLPPKWFRNLFTARASSMVLLGLGFMVYVALNITTGDNDHYPADLVRLAPFVGAAILAVTFLIGWIKPVRALLENLAERASIFSYIFLPLGIVSLLFVVARNFL